MPALDSFKSNECVNFPGDEKGGESRGAGPFVGHSIRRGCPLETVFKYGAQETNLVSLAETPLKEKRREWLAPPAGSSLQP